MEMTTQPIIRQRLMESSGRKFLRRMYTKIKQVSQLLLTRSQWKTRRALKNMQNHLMSSRQVRVSMRMSKAMMRYLTYLVPITTEKISKMLRQMPKLQPRAQIQVLQKKGFKQHTSLFFIFKFESYLLPSKFYSSFQLSLAPSSDSSLSGRDKQQQGRVVTRIMIFNVILEIYAQQHKIEEKTESVKERLRKDSQIFSFISSLQRLMSVQPRLTARGKAIERMMRSTLGCLMNVASTARVATRQKWMLICATNFQKRDIEIIKMINKYSYCYIKKILAYRYVPKPMTETQMMMILIWLINLSMRGWP